MARIRILRKRLFLLLTAILFTSVSLQAAEEDILPPQLPKEQRERLQKFLVDHSQPERFFPKNAKVVDSKSPVPIPDEKPVSAKSIKQYTVQIVQHRPTPDQPRVNKVDVLYYRPNPEKGKAGITVKYTVDLETGNQVGETEVLLKAHTPISREETEEAVALAKEKSPELKALYANRDPKSIRWEYLQMMVTKKLDQVQVGDRVVRIVFTAAPAQGESEAPPPLRVLVDLTRQLVIKDDR
ncbi:hypothetical protein KIH39_11020 [Telmatocola sphagniphila]|uniref:Uncharacterized protein n=1 Tax=Telmatocola sphagniphila TaxID=1123043 RepID=A0A8E6B9P5_9BACT|nr:hypothetical protein [Telmatocola sphagniphila]QVL34408.1 hypothetical protein KIH39_11020 [Telmatocola sphagniphila]